MVLHVILLTRVFGQFQILNYSSNYNGRCAIKGQSVGRRQVPCSSGSAPIFYARDASGLWSTTMLYRTKIWTNQVLPSVPKGWQSIPKTDNVLQGKVQWKLPPLQERWLKESDWLYKKRWSRLPRLHRKDLLRENWYSASTVWKGNYDDYHWAQRRWVRIPGTLRKYCEKISRRLSTTVQLAASLRLRCFVPIGNFCVRDFVQFISIFFVLN